MIATANCSENTFRYGPKKTSCIRTGHDCCIRLPDIRLCLITIVADAPNDHIADLKCPCGIGYSRPLHLDRTYSIAVAQHVAHLRVFQQDVCRSYRSHKNSWMIPNPRRVFWMLADCENI